MKLKITWLEYHNSANWTSIKEMEEAYHGKVVGEDTEGWCTLEIYREFEANTIEEAKQKATALYEGDNGVFIVTDEQGNRIFDEQDLEDTI